MGALKLFGLEITKAKAAPIPPQGDDVDYAALFPRKGSAYIYALIDPRTNQVRYIGKTFNVLSRFRGHCKDKGPTYKAKWIRELRAAGYSPRIEIVEIINTGNQKDWEAAERQWISNFKLLGCKLTNLTEGGDSGWALSLDARSRISRARKGKSRPPHVGVAVAAANRNRSQEWRAKKSLQASNISDETRFKMRVAALGMTEAKRKAISETVSKHWANGVYKPHSKESYERSASKLRGQKRTPEQRARMSIAAKKRDAQKAGAV